MRHACRIATGLMILMLPVRPACGQVSGDSPATFEVVSIKRSSPDAGRSGFSIRPGGRLLATNVPARLLIAAAYRVEPVRVVGGPRWLDDDRFDIEATGPTDLTRELVEPLLRGVLADRFDLRMRREPREMPVLFLARAQNTGSGLKPSSLDCSPAGARARAQAGPATATGPICAIANANSPAPRITGGGVSMAALAEVLSLHVGRPVVDRTGLAGLFDFDLQFAPGPSAGVDAPPSPTEAPSLATALREGLGFALESGVAPLEVIVVESIERPSQN